MRNGKHIESDYLFCSHSNNSNNKNKPLSRNTVEKIVKDAGEKAGIKDPVWPHKLRHTFATSILRRGGNIYYIKELLGHQNISTTQTYLSATNDDLRKTQELLLNDARRYEKEVLAPIPEQTIIKDNSLFNKFQDFLQANGFVQNSNTNQNPYQNQNYGYNNQQFNNNYGYNNQGMNGYNQNFGFNGRGVSNYAFGS